MRRAPMRKDALLGARFFFVAPRPADRRVEAVKVQRLPQRLGLHHVGMPRRTVAERADILPDAVGVDMDQQIEAEFADALVAKGDHLAKLPGRIDVQQGNGGLPGWKAFIARCSSTEESLPIEYSMTGLRNSAATSRMM